MKLRDERPISRATGNINVFGKGKSLYAFAIINLYEISASKLIRDAVLMSIMEEKVWRTTLNQRFTRNSITRASINFVMSDLFSQRKK